MMIGPERLSQLLETASDPAENSRSLVGSVSHLEGSARPLARNGRHPSRNIERLAGNTWQFAGNSRPLAVDSSFGLGIAGVTNKLVQVASELAGVTRELVRALPEEFAIELPLEIAEELADETRREFYQSFAFCWPMN